MTEMPLFPLSGVLLPGGRMPLQIFEQRYLDLVRESMKSDSPFGIVWIRRMHFATRENVTRERQGFNSPAPSINPACQFL